MYYLCILYRVVLSLGVEAALYDRFYKVKEDTL